MGVQSRDIRAIRRQTHIRGGVYHTTTTSRRFTGTCHTTRPLRWGTPPPVPSPTSRYDDLSDETRSDESVFADKGALDPLAEPDDIHARADQERQLATDLNGVHEGYRPPTVSIYGPPGTGKTTTTRRVCREFATRPDALAVEYVNLKECRSLFSTANEIHFELTGEKLGAYDGLDGVFAGIWPALADYLDWTILLLDEIDHIQRDSNYEPSDFFYGLLRGEGKLQHNIGLSLWLLTSELLDVERRLNSRVTSAMSDEEVWFPPYSVDRSSSVLITGHRFQRRATELTARCTCVLSMLALSSDSGLKSLCEKKTVFSAIALLVGSDTVG